jgi:glycosyltransferase involved in cell wall biosynthesis
MRILHVVGKLDYGGAETWLVQILRHIDRQKYQMDFLGHTTDPGAYDAEVRALGARTIPCLSPSNPLQYAFNFRRLLREHGPYDVVHSHVHHYSGYVLMLAATAGVKVRIAHSHSDTRSAEASKSVERRAYLRAMRTMIRAFATRGLAVSAEAGCDLFAPQWRDRTDKWQLQYLGIDLSKFEIEVNAEEVRRSLGIPPDALVIGHVGRFCEPKNHAFLVEIAREVVRMEPRSCFLLVGDGPLRAAIEEKVRNYGLARHFVFAGLRSDVPTLMKGVMDVFLFPSLYEGLPLAVLEAQAAGLTGVVSDIVPRESDVIPDLVDRLSLRHSASTWAHALLAQAGHMERPRWCDVMDRLAGRSIESSVESLTSTYQHLQAGPV